jgi:hypothetical protein
MHLWGDNWEYWDKMIECVDRCYELAEEAGLPVLQIKEKFGTLRFYIGQLDTDEMKAKYRKLYETLVAEYPMLKHEILGDADWFKELLVGLVPEEECDHQGGYWSGDKERWCGTCGKDFSDKMNEIEERITDGTTN